MMTTVKYAVVIVIMLFPFTCTAARIQGSTATSCSDSVRYSADVFHSDVTTFSCPAYCNMDGNVWGTEVYTDDSKVCKAAVHDGRIMVEYGGVVYVKKWPGQLAYQPSTKYGITTSAYGPWSGSFRFCDTADCGNISENVLRIACGSNVRQSQAYFHAPSTAVICPPCDTSFNVWGTGIYTDDSAICTAAIHDGKITAQGGITFVEKMPGRSSYSSSSANGVTTKIYGRWDSSYRFSDNTTSRTTALTIYSNINIITCSSSVRGSPNEFSELVNSVRCPANCDTSANVWGAGVYTDDSSVCKAAIHDGRIEVIDGGIVHVRKLAGKNSYSGTTNNGITTSSYGIWGASFQFCVNSECSTVISCSDSVRHLANTFSSDITTVTCPANCDVGGNVWGTEVYTDDSRVCKAAVHDGRFLSEEGGVVYVKKWPGQLSYQSSTKHEITTTDYGSWSESFRFCDTPNCENIGDNSLHIACDTNIRGNPSQFQDLSTAVICPPCDTIHNVWGTGVYTDDSAICTAATHDGRISAGEGGLIFVEKWPGRSNYTSSTANGVTTKSYGEWDVSYSFSDGTTSTTTLPTIDSSINITISCTSTVRGSPNEFGELLSSVRCPANCNVAANVWGTWVYTDDSSVCKAAIHHGQTTVVDGGIVHVRKLPGRKSYSGTTNNGITTSSYGSWDASFQFCENSECSTVLSCGDSVRHSADTFSSDITIVTCPANCGIGGNVWGTEVYTDDSGVCKAAVHDGRILGGEGGVVYVKKLPGQLSYQSSTKHGITTTDYGSWSGSFRFCDTANCENIDVNSLYIACDTNMRANPSYFQALSTAVICPPCDTLHNVWGTGVYTDDSAICTAAIHEGKISDQGGLAVVKKMPGRSTYSSSTANNVITKSYGAWDASYGFCETVKCLNIQD